MRIGPKSAWCPGQDFILDRPWIINYDHGVHMESIGEKASWFTFKAQLLDTRFKVEGKGDSYPFFITRLSGPYLVVKVDLYCLSNCAKQWTNWTSRKKHREEIWLESLREGKILKREQRYVEFVCGGRVIFHVVFRKKICLLGILPTVNLNDQYFYI